jgi:hypothetical protein
MINNTLLKLSSLSKNNYHLYQEIGQIIDYPISTSTELVCYRSTLLGEAIDLGMLSELFK